MPSHACIKARDVDASWLGPFDSGLLADGFAASLALQTDDDLGFKPANRCECASGSAAVYAARDAIKSGSARAVLVIGVKRMTAKDTASPTKALAGASYRKQEANLFFPQIFARIADSYVWAYSDKSAVLGRIAAKNHNNALGNSLVQHREDLSINVCNTVSEKNPLIAPPLRTTDAGNDSKLASSAST